MEETAKLIADDIESGKYFTEARFWYNRVHLQPLSETSVMSLIVAVLAAIVLLVSYNLYAIFPEKTKVQTVLYLPSTLEKYPVLSNIAQPGKTTKQVVVEYLCGRYVLARESYNYNSLIYGYNFIFRSSSKQLFDAYYQNLALANPNSPIVLYKEDKTVTVDIDEENIQADTGNGVVKFTSTIRDKQGKMISTAKWMAELSFYIDNYDFSKSINAPLSFIVTKYDVKQIATN